MKLSLRVAFCLLGIPSIAELQAQHISVDSLDHKQHTKNYLAEDGTFQVSVSSQKATQTYLDEAFRKEVSSLRLQNQRRQELIHRHPF